MGPEEVVSSAPSAEPVLKPLDAWWTVLVVDPVAVRFVNLVRPWSAVTPMRLTVLAHVLGLVTAVLFLGGQFIWAAALFELRFVLDCADGKLARQRGTASAAGAYVDYVGDFVIVGANLVGLALWLVWDADASVLLGVLLPTTFLAAMAVGQSTTQVGTVPLASDAMPGGYRAWMTARRLKPLPSRIDVEHGLLFVLPLIAAAFDESWPLVVGAVVASSYFAYVTVRLCYGGYRLATRSDRERSGAA